MYGGVTGKAGDRLPMSIKVLSQGAALTHHVNGLLGLTVRDIAAISTHTNPESHDGGYGSQNGSIRSRTHSNSL